MPMCVQRDEKRTFSSLPKASSPKGEKKEEKRKKSCPFPFFSPHTSNANEKCVVLDLE
jgi:hypothetical protein